MKARWIGLTWLVILAWSITVYLLAISGLYRLFFEQHMPCNGQTPEKAADIPQNAPQGKLFRVTAYCPCPKCCGVWADGQTASGYWIQPGDRFVAAPKHIPFGTKLIVPGYNNDQPVEVKDRGGAITVNRLDVYFDSHQQALNWGVKHLNVKEMKGATNGYQINYQGRPEER